MRRPPPQQLSMSIDPPSGATHWSIWKVTPRNRTTNDPGRRDQLSGEAQADGNVPSAWPIDQFSKQNVLEQWGDGRYRVEWYDANNEHMKGQGQLFEVAKPKGRPAKPPKLQPRLRPSSEAEPAYEPPAAAGNGSQTIGFLEVLTLLRAERESAREQEAQRAERDRQWQMQLQQQNTQLLQAILGNRSSPADGDLLRRELNQTIREQLFAFREEQQRREGELEPEEPEGTDPPRDIEEAGNRIGLALLGELEHKAPELLNKFLPNLLNTLKGQGFTPSPELEAQIRERHANGR